MSDPKKKGPNVVRGKLAPERPITVLFTLRDRWGSPIPQMKMTMTQAGAALKAASGDIVTDAAGRVSVDRVTSGIPLEIKLDEKFLPADDEDRRKTQYVYTLDEKLDAVIKLEVDDDPDGKLAIVDTKRAYATLVAGVDLFRPVFRSPWKNPVHTVDADNRIYRSRVLNLRFIVHSLFGLTKADAEALDHAGLVNKLIELFQASQKAAAAALQTAPPASTDMGTQPEPAPPAPPAPPSEPPPPGPVPPVQSAERAVPMKDVTLAPIPPRSPAPNPPAAAPNAAVDSPALPRWVWYLLFHHTGLRYSPPSGKPPPDDKTQYGAHGCYVAPALFLKAMRTQEIEEAFGSKASTPSSSDVTEALVLIERGKADAAQKALLLSGDVAKANKALNSIFTKIRNTEEARLVTFRTPDNFYDGDYVAIGLLKAKRLRRKAILTDDIWKEVTTRTQLRSDVPAHGWEDIEQFPAVLAAFMKPLKLPQFDLTQWRSRRQQTLDTILTAAVCDQTSETGELIRSRHVGNAIPGNATICPSLQYLTFANAKNVRRGMHFFYTGFGLVKKGEQQYVAFNNVEGGQSIFESNPDPSNPKLAVQELAPVASIDILSESDLDGLLDAQDPSNVAAAAANARLRAAGNVTSTLLPRVVVASDKRFEGARRLDASLLGNATISEARKRFALVRCVVEKDGKVRLHVAKWTHQEIVVDVKLSVNRIQISLFSTEGGPTASDGTGLRVYSLSPTTASGRETRHLNILFGSMHASANENIDVLDACSLNPTTLKP